MKRVSCTLFFSVLWRGVCQVLEWFFGLFGYRRDGKFAKCVWGLFAVSSAVIMSAFAVAAVVATYEVVDNEIASYRIKVKDAGEYVSEYISFVKYYGEDEGYLVNKETGKKILKGVEWIAMPSGEDSLVCYSDGKRRGYFSKYTGKVVVMPRFKHAWIFSDGVAGVEVDGRIKFIDPTGKAVIDNGLMACRGGCDYVYHGGYCVVKDRHSGKVGLMDKTGEMVLPVEYDDICSNGDFTFRSVEKNGQTTVFDRDMKAVLRIEGRVWLSDIYIDVIMPDNSVRKYDYAGNLVHDFYIDSVRSLTYETDEIYYSAERFIDDEGDEYVAVEEMRKRRVAGLRAYAAGGCEGLMTAEGHVVTKPLYEYIEAIGADLYLCTVADDDKVIVNGKGVIVK